MQDRLDLQEFWGQAVAAQLLRRDPAKMKMDYSKMGSLGGMAGSPGEREAGGSSCYLRFMVAEPVFFDLTVKGSQSDI